VNSVNAPRLTYRFNITLEIGFELFKLFSVHTLTTRKILPPRSVLLPARTNLNPP
jgi:hypothetical protein